MWNIGYFISNIHTRSSLMVAAVISQAGLTWFCPGYVCRNVWPLQTAEQLMQIADPSVIFLKQSVRSQQQTM